MKRGALIWAASLLAGLSLLAVWRFSKHAKPEPPAPAAAEDVPAPGLHAPAARGTGARAKTPSAEAAGPATPKAVRPAAEKPPSVAPTAAAAPDIPPADADELAQQKAYPLIVSYASVTEWENRSAPKIYFKLELPQTPEDASVLGVSDFHITNCIANTGASVTDAQQPAALDEFPPLVIAAGTVPRPQVYLQFTAPPDATELAYVKATASLLRAGKQAHAQWDYPAAQLPARTEIGGSFLTLNDFSTDDSHVNVNLDCVWQPSELDAIVGLRPGMEMTLRYTDGSADSVWCGQVSQQHLGLIFTDRRKRTPAAFEFSFLAPAALEHVPQQFVLRHVALPTRDLRDVPVGKRGPREIQVQGVRFLLQDVSLRGIFQNKTVSRDLRVFGSAVEPPELVAAGHKARITILRATDDLGTELSFSSRTPDAGSPRALSLPNPQADRLTKLAGKYTLVAANQEQEQSVEVSETEAHRVARQPGGLTLLWVNSTPEGVHCSFQLPLELLPEAVREAARAHGDGDPPFVSTVMYDANGDVLSSQGNWSASEKAYHITKVLKRGFKTARLVARYPRAEAIREIPFEFNDIGLPRPVAPKAAPPPDEF